MSGVEVECDRSGPYEVIRIGNGPLRLALVPALGGRLLSARRHGTEFLYRNPRLLDDKLHPVDGRRPEPVGGPMSQWRNFGGDKSWPAPQGWSGPAEWAGPPDPVLDSGEYTVRVDRGVHSAVPDGPGAVTATMTSGDDPRTGLRITRAVTLLPGRSAYRLDIRLDNTSHAVRQWAPWNVTQLCAGTAGETGAPGVYVGDTGEAAPVPLIAGNAHPAVEPAAPGVLRVPAQDVVGKVGFPGASGFLAAVGSAGTMTQRYAVTDGGDYPDSGSRAEVWLECPLDEPLAHLGGLRPVDRVVEMEALGPLARLEPGGHTELRLDVGFGSGTAPITGVDEDGYWSEQPRWHGRAGETRVSGVFTAFATGTLCFRAGSGGTRTALGRVEAGEPLRFDARVGAAPAPPGAVFEVQAGHDDHGRMR